jgi:hypothetical protein
VLARARHVVVEEPRARVPAEAKVRGPHEVPALQRFVEEGREALANLA